MIELSVEGTISIDPEEEDLDGRIAEFLEGDEVDPAEARREALWAILSENIGHTGLNVELWEEV